jgi:hypothetical protein
LDDQRGNLHRLSEITAAAPALLAALCCEGIGSSQFREFLGAAGLTSPIVVMLVRARTRIAGAALLPQR